MTFRLPTVLLLGLIMWGGLSVAVPEEAQAQRAREIIMRVGETHEIFIGNIKAVSVGNQNVIEVKKHRDGNKIVVFGLRPGYSSLTVGDVNHEITVVGDIERLRKDVETLILDIPGVEVLTSGDRVVIDGIVKRRDDWDRIESIVASNKNLVYSLVLLDERDIVKRAQLQLHFQVLEVNRNRSHNVGVDWTSNGPFSLVLDTMSYVQFGLGEIRDQFGGVRTPDDLLKLNSQLDVRRILDKDFFTTVSGEEVKFQRGKTLIFTAVDAQSGVTTFYEKKIGLVVAATPVIDDDGDIDLTIDIKFSTVGELELNGNVPSINTQEHRAHVQLREGESFALSGFFQRSKGSEVNGLPGLKDIPGLGVLFSTRDWEKGEVDGIIVLTPVLLDPDRRSMRKQIKETLDIYDAADSKW
jgi:pilus assembly protein CpaC